MSVGIGKMKKVLPIKNLQINDYKYLIKKFEENI